MYLSQNKQLGTEGEGEKRGGGGEGENKKDLMWPLLDAGSEASLQIACSQGEQGAHEAEGTFVV